MSKMNTNTLKLSSVPRSIGELEPYIEKIATKYDIQADKYPNILISLTEAVNNAIIHGNNKDESKYVKICAKETKTSLVFEVCDEGNGFNPNTIPDPTAPENIECCGGRGVFLMKELSDKIDFFDNGRKVTIHFNL